MKTTRKVLALALAFVMMLALAVPVFADEDPATSGSITILNAVKGTEYDLYKIFDASVGADGAITYIAPDGFEGNDYFAVENGYVTATEDAVDTDGKLTEDAIASLADLVESLSPEATQTADGSAVVFDSLDFGYYYITSSLVDDALVIVDTVDKDVVLYEKNITEPEWHPENPDTPGDGLGKTIVTADGVAEEASYNFGDTITFQIKIDTVNFVDDAKQQITSYLIGDDMPDGLEFVEITSVTVTEPGEDAVDAAYVATSGGFPIKVQWVDFENGAAADGYYTSLYAHGSILTVTYTATLLNTAVIDGDGNVNTASFNYKTYDPENPPTTPDDPTDPETPDDGDGTSKNDTATVYTYALVIKKVDPEGAALNGATFSIAGLTTTGSAGAYEYSAKTAASGTDTAMATNSDGILIVKGVAAGEYSVSEVEAPDGYNKLTEATPVTATKTGATTTSVTVYLDEDGNVTDEETETTVTYTNDSLSAAVAIVVNFTGMPLPSTGGIGTTLFVTFGMIAVLAAGVFLVTNKRISKEDI